jgi:hypothetical protein
MKLENIIKLRLNNFKVSYTDKMAEGEGLEGACWEGYEPIGMKELDGKMVPNCVPIKAGKVKEGFPIPSPSDEDEDKYIGRCISAIVDEYPEEGQAYAVCKSKWDEK